jgi:hypothetical protein
MSLRQGPRNNNKKFFVQRRIRDHGGVNAADQPLWLLDCDVVLQPAVKAAPFDRAFAETLA